MTTFPENTESSLLCPRCFPRRKLVVQTQRPGGRQRLGCPNWPACSYTRPIPEDWKMRAAGQPGLFDALEGSA